MTSLINQTQSKAIRKGENDAINKRPRDSKARTGSMWNKYYNIGYSSIIPTKK